MSSFFLTLFLFIRAFLGNSESSLMNMFPNQQEIPEPDRIMMKIMDQAVKEISAKYPMHPCGMGMSGKFRHVSIEFQVFQKLAKNEARELLIDCTNIFLKTINQNKDVRPYLEEYPFTLKNVGICFYINDEKQKKVFYPDICVARWYSNGVYFRTYDPEKEYAYKETREETHEEALELVKQYRTSQIAQQDKKNS